MMHFRLVCSLLMLIACTPVAAEVTVVTDKPVYDPGEVVTITIQNSGPEVAGFDAWPLYMIISSETGSVIFGWDRVALVTIFPPGHTEQFTRDTGLVPDSPGQYAIHLNLGQIGTDVGTVYQVRYPAATELSAWSGIKALYR
jgi:hypothetical protein